MLAAQTSANGQDGSGARTLPAPAGSGERAA
jgi:hypothetical protein